MTPQRRAKYASVIAKCIRKATMDTRITWPGHTILVVKSYSELAELNNIIGLPIYVMDMPSAYDFFIAFPSDEINHYKLQKAFQEYLDLYGSELDSE